MFRKLSPPVKPTSLSTTTTAKLLSVYKLLTDLRNFPTFSPRDAPRSPGMQFHNKDSTDRFHIGTCLESVNYQSIQILGVYTEGDLLQAPIRDIQN